jgi:hypothetical protein
VGLNALVMAKLYAETCGSNEGVIFFVTEVRLVVIKK